MLKDRQVIWNSDSYKHICYETSSGFCPIFPDIPNFVIWVKEKFQSIFQPSIFWWSVWQYRRLWLPISLLGKNVSSPANSLHRKWTNSCVEISLWMKPVSHSVRFKYLSFSANSIYFTQRRSHLLKQFYPSPKKKLSKKTVWVLKRAFVTPVINLPRTLKHIFQKSWLKFRSSFTF